MAGYYCYPTYPAVEHPCYGGWPSYEEQERHVFEYIPSIETCPALQPAFCYPSVYAPPAPVCIPAAPAVCVPAPVAANYVCAPSAPPIAPVYTIPQAQPAYIAAAPNYPSSFPIGPQPGLNMHDAYKEPHAWHGRTRWQVEQDNQQMALKEGVWQNNEATPRDPKPDQQFWCIELDGSKTLRTADTIENALRPGRWHKDPFYGNMYYVRAPKEAEAGKTS